MLLLLLLPLLSSVQCDSFRFSSAKFNSLLLCSSILFGGSHSSNQSGRGTFLRFDFHRCLFTTATDREVNLCDDDGELQL